MADTVIALLSLVLSVSLAIVYVRDRRHAKFTLESEYITALCAWHEQVVAVLIRARLLGRDRQNEAHREDLASLSALIEQGRFYFPNIEKGDFGEDKPPAYRGYRNLALDFLVASYNLLDKKGAKEAAQELELLQRHFTSVVFELVRPRERLRKIALLTDQYLVKDQSFEDFLKHKDGSVIKHIWRGRN